MAKIASTRCKPDGLLLIRPEETVPYLHSLPVSALWGVGGKTVEVLARRGIRTVADVAASPLPSLRKLLGASGEHVYRLSWGIDPRPVTPVRLEKSIGAEETFATDTADEALLHRELLRLSHRTAERLRGAGMHARTVALKLRYADFSTITRSRTVSTPIDSAQLLYAVAVQLLESVGDRPMTVRLVGIRAEQLEEAARRPAAAQPGPPGRQLAGRRTSARRRHSEVRQQVGSAGPAPGPGGARQVNPAGRAPAGRRPLSREGCRFFGPGGPQAVFQNRPQQSILINT